MTPSSILSKHGHDSQYRDGTFRFFLLAKCFSACGHSLANFLLAPIHYFLNMYTRLPNLLIGGVYHVQAFVGSPFASL